MSEQHTPTPWAHRNGRIYQADRDVLTIANIARAFDGDYSEANARRIVACVNACAGIDTDKLERAGGLAEINVRMRLLDAEKQREQLLAALKHIASEKPQLMHDDRQQEVICYYALNPAKVAREAIAAVEGGKWN